MPKKKFSRVNPLERRICGLYQIGNEEEKIADILNLSIEEVKDVLVQKEYIQYESSLDVELVVERVPSIEDGLVDISGLLAKIGEKGVDAIIRKRAKEMRKYGRCLSDNSNG